MPDQTSLRALRALLLPLRTGPEIEQKYVAELERALEQRGVDRGDFGSWVSINLAEWADSGRPPNTLKSLVRSIIALSGGSDAETLSRVYFSLHRRLCDQHLLDHEEGRWFLTHSFTISELGGGQLLSAAQIAKSLENRDERVKFSRQSVRTILDTLGLGSQLTLTEERVEKLFEDDAKAEVEFLADADLANAAEIVGDVGVALGFPGELTTQLNILSSDADRSRYAPYLQILHYQATLAEYFDHALTDLYEFSPRGGAANCLFKKYPPVLAGSGNPFLNNAKSVERVHPAWVRAKKKNERRGAAALYSILHGLETVGFAARRELSRLIRLWLHRLIRLSKADEAELPASLGVEQWRNVVSAVSTGNTSSFGIIEQRVMDAVAVMRHPNPDIWRPRGIGAPVNGTNVSQRKLGDCDFQNSDQKKIKAYESHGGLLTQTYVDYHLLTLRKTVALRSEELQGIADLEDWEATIIFVSHDIAKGVKAPTTDINGINISFEFIKFSDLLAPPPDQDVLDAYVLAPLRLNRTPDEVRRRLLEIASPPF